MDLEDASCEIRSRSLEILWGLENQMKSCNYFEPASIWDEQRLRNFKVLKRPNKADWFCAKHRKKFKTFKCVSGI